jgi:magnesium-transporting ATPase (P-type)
MPWVSIFAIVCGLLMELLMTWTQFSQFKKPNKLSKEAFTGYNSFLTNAFFYILLLEDLPQIAVVVGYRAYSPKEPGTYNYYLEFFTFASSILSIFSKTTAAAW